MRYLTSGLIMLALGLLLGFRITTSPLSVVAAFALVMVFAFALCWVFTALAMVVGQPRSVQGLGRARDVAADVRQQRLRAHRHPASWLRGFVEINPVTHVADAARGLLSGGPVAAPVTFALIASAVVIAVFAPLAVYLYRRRT